MSVARRRGHNSSNHERALSPSSGSLSYHQFPEHTASQSATDMSSKNRTAEFRAAIEAVKGQANGSLQRRGGRSAALKQKTQFTQLAQGIGRDLSQTFEKLEALTEMCKRKSLFDDRQAEIGELTHVIKQDIQGLNQKVTQLQQIARTQRGRPGGGRQTQSHSDSVVLSLQSRLMSMSSGFKGVLEERTENLKAQKSRREHFSDSPIQSSLPPSAIGGRSHGSLLLEDEYNSRPTALGGDIAIDMSQMQVVAQNDQYIQSRADAMKNIEGTIVELGGIFQQLSLMVKEQEETVQRIDHNVEDTQMNIDNAHSELTKFLQSVSSNRWLMIKIFGVLIFFFIIFIVFMA